MELISVSRTAGDGSVQEVFVARCPEHNWYYKGQPPITTGCRECWHTYYFAQLAQSSGDKRVNFDQLESAIRGVAADVESGNWDFIPEFEMKIEHEKD